jgi:carbonic anhydrase/acetyltransferase-like protein (isoleucine patch superfamily)
MQELSHLSAIPVIDPTAFIAPSAEIIGDVTIGARSSVFYQAVLRADIHAIRIGAETNLQDGVIVHLSSHLPTIVGDRVTCGHRALLHACTIEDECLIGMASTIMDGARIGRQSIVAAGAVVLPGTEVPAGSLVAGCPAVIKRALSHDERAALAGWAEKYLRVAEAHRAKLQPGN